MLKTLIDRATALAAKAAHLRVALTRLQTVNADAESSVDALAAADLGYLRLVKRPAERAREVADFEREFREARRTAAGVLLFDITSSWPSLDADLRAWREQSKQAPPPVAAYLARTGGHHLSLSTSDELTIQLLDEARRSRFAAELQAAQPALVHDLYAAAVHLDTDESASFVRYCESVHGGGWRGRTPESSEQVQAAVALRSLIAQTQAARVPPELDEAAAAVEQASRLAAKAENPQLHNVTAVSLQQHPELADLWEAERPLLEAAAEAAEQAEPPEPAEAAS